MPAGKLVSDDDIKKEIENLNIKKSSIYGFIPASILKQRLGAYIPQLTTSFQHNSIPQELKLSEMIHYRRRTISLLTIRPASLLPQTSKVFETILHKQITNYMRDKSNKSITDFKKSHETQHSLVVMLEKRKRAIDKGQCVSELFMDLSKAFHTINHDLMIAKRKAFSFSGEALKFMQSYLKNRK